MVQNVLKIKCTLRTHQTSLYLNCCLFPNNYETEAKNMNNLLRKTSVATSITKWTQDVKLKSDENFCKQIGKGNVRKTKNHHIKILNQSLKSTWTTILAFHNKYSLEEPIEPHFRDEALITHVFKIKCGSLKSHSIEPNQP